MIGFIDPGHRLDHHLVEQFRDRAYADDGRRLDGFDRGDKGTDRCMLVRKRFLEIGNVHAGTDHQAVDIEQPVAAPSIVDRQGFQRHRLADQFGDAGSGRTAAEEQDLLLCQLLPGDPQRREDPGKGHRRGALDIVVIGTN
jgi:hypothetical protein